MQPTNNPTPPNNKLKIILVEWQKYPLKRSKKLGENTIQCGLGPLLENIAKYESGIELDVTLIITDVNNSTYYFIKIIFKLLANILKLNKQSFLSEIHGFLKYKNLKYKYPFIKNIYYKDNIGFDIGAYNYGYNILKKSGYDGDIVFMNSGLAGPCEDNWLSKYSNQFSKRKDVGLCGISMNPMNTKIEGSPFSPHVQSFFLYTQMKIMLDVFPENLPGSFIKNDRTSIITEGEIGISQAVLNAGYSITCTAEPLFFYKHGVHWDIPYEELRYKKEYSKYANTI